MGITRVVWIAGAIVIGALACAPLPPPGAVFIERRPPRNRIEVVAVSPGPQYVWIGGYWRWSGGDYDWVAGRWAPIESGRRGWQQGHWAHGKRGWFWIEGRWR